MATAKQQRENKDDGRISNVILNQRPTIFLLSFRCGKRGENDNEVPSEMRSLLEGSFLLKNFMLSRLRAAIDINDVLHYYQFHFVLIFSPSLEELLSCVQHAPILAPCEIMIKQFILLLFSLRKLHMIHSRNFRLHIENVFCVFFFVTNSRFFASIVDPMTEMFP